MRIDSPQRYQEPEFLPWDGRRVPLTFVGGYLGAGKTTAINELLASADRPIAVVVNDVGSVNIDARLIRRQTSDLIELTDGCVCCSAIDGMGAALDAIRARPVPPDHVVVELSGVADPQRMIPWGHSAGFRLDGLVVVAAADQLLPRSLPVTVMDQICAHISAADLILLTKTDLVDGQAAHVARKLLARAAPHIPVVESADFALKPGALGRLLALGGRRSGDVIETPDPSMFDLHEVTTIDAPPTGTLSELRLWLNKLLESNQGREHNQLSHQRHNQRQLVRAKAVLDTTDCGLVLVQIVGARVEIEKLPAPEQQQPTQVIVITVRAAPARLE